MGELKGESGEDIEETPAVFEIARTEEGRSQPSVGEDVLGDGLGDRGLPGPGEAVQPVDGGRVVILGPQFNVVEDVFSGPFQAAGATPVSEFRPLSTSAAVQHRQFSCWSVSVCRLQMESTPDLLPARANQHPVAFRRVRGTLTISLQLCS